MKRKLACLIAGAFLLVGGCTGDSPPGPSGAEGSNRTGAERKHRAGPAETETLLKIELELSKHDDLFSFAVDEAGNVFVVNVAQSRVEVYDRRGRLTTSWGTKGDGPGEFDFTLGGARGRYNRGGLDIDAEGNVYVADTGNARVQKFDRDGKLLVAWGGKGNADGLFQQPSDIAISGTGDVYVLDDESLHASIQRFTPNGRFLENLSDPRTSTPSLLGEALMIEVGPDGSLYVPATGHHVVYRFDENGKLLQELNGSPDEFVEPADIAIASNGTGYVADLDETWIDAINPNGRRIFWIEGAGNVPFKHLHTVAIDAKNNLYVSDDRLSAIFKLKVTPP